jgi:hypothetical protein
MKTRGTIALTLLLTACASDVSEPSYLTAGQDPSEWSSDPVIPTMTRGAPQPLALEEVAGVEVNGEWECRHGSGVTQVSVRDDAVLWESSGGSAMSRDVANLGSRVVWEHYESDSQYSLNAGTGLMTMYYRRLDGTLYYRCTKA